MDQSAAQLINLDAKFGCVAEQWRPRIVGVVNDHEVKIVKVQGKFPWHRHEDPDEMFLVHRGMFQVEFRDRLVTLSPGELIIVPRGIEHRTLADEEAEVMIFEAADVVNTGNVVDEMFTAPKDARI